MDFRVNRVNGIASGSVTAGTLDAHGDLVGMINTGVVIDKTSMTGGAIAAAVITAKGRSILANGRP